MLSFTTLSLNDAAKIQNFVNQFKPYSDFNFISLYSWSLHSQIKYCLTDDGLFLIMPHYVTQQPIFSFIAKDPVRGLRAYVEWFRANSIEIRLELLPDFMIPELEIFLAQTGAKYKVVNERGAYDYVISPSRILAAAGSEFSDLRYKLAKFEKNWAKEIQPADFDPHNPADVKKAAVLANKWAERKKARSELFEDELYAFNRFLQAAQHVDNLRFSAYQRGGELVGLASAEVLGNGYAIGHFLKNDTSVAGIYYKLVTAMCAQLHGEGVEKLNIEQDLDIPGLRETKLRLRPVEFLQKFTVWVES